MIPHISLLCRNGCPSTCKDVKCESASHQRQFNLFDKSFTDNTTMIQTGNIFIGCELRLDLTYWIAIPNPTLRFLSREVCEAAILDKANKAGVRLIKYDTTNQKPYTTMFAHIRQLLVIFHDPGTGRYYGVIRQSIPNQTI